MTKRVLFHTLAVLLLIALPAAQTYGKTDTGEGEAVAQPPASGVLGVEFQESFDDYADGSDVHGQGGWKGWDNNPAGGALVTSAFSLSAPHSVDVAGGSDLVHEYVDYTSGQWIYTAWVYVPSGTTNGPSYFILLNTYADGGPNNWSTQVFFDAVAGVVQSDSDGSFLPLVTDAWVELRVEIDLDANNQDFYYDDQLLHSFSWTEGISGGGALNIGAVDLFANFASSVYYDDISLCPAPGCEPEEPPVPVVEVPTANHWALFTLALLLVAVGLVALWRRQIV